MAYNNIDGVGELGMGFFMAMIALLEWTHFQLPAHSMWNSGVVPMVSFGLIVAAVHFGSKAIKKRVTYRRTGFVEYRTRDHWRWGLLGGLVAAVTSVGLALAERRHWNLLTAPVSLVGLVIAASYAYGIARTARWKWAVVWALAIGSLEIAKLPAAVLKRISNDTSLSTGIPAASVGAILLCFALYGCLLLISGAITFALYLRRHPAASREEA